MALCEYGPDGNCGRKAVARGMCHSHRLRRLAGKPLDTPDPGVTRATKKGRMGSWCLPLPPDPRVRLRGASHSRPNTPPYCGVWASGDGGYSARGQVIAEAR
jgi:hypothetical protein